MKKLIALFVAAVSVCTVFAFSACGSSGVSESKLNKIKDSQGDKVTLAVWSKAMTSSDIYNSTAVWKTESESIYASGTTTSRYVSESTVTVYNDLTSRNDVVTGIEHALMEYEYYSSDSDEQSYSSYSAEAYVALDSTTLTKYMEQGDYCTISVETGEDGYGEDSTLMDGVYVHYEYSGGEFDGCAYSDFKYDEDLGSYVYDYTSGNYTYEYELKFSDGNLVYCRIDTIYYSKSASSTSDRTETNEYYYIYDKVSLSVPKSVQKQIDTMSDNL